MNTQLTFVSFALVLIALTACDKKSSSEPPGSGTTTPAAQQPAAPVIPQSGNEATTQSGSGPHEAGTAIGGVAGNQEKDGAKTGGTPAPTGGDGTAPKSSPY